MTMNTHNPQEEFEAAITRALEHAPEVSAAAIPSYFSARVVAALPKQRAARPVMRTGRTVAVVALVVLAIVLFALAPHVTASFTSVTFYIELIVLAQLGAIAYWLAAKREV
jgi:hypothetical protein